MERHYLVYQITNLINNKIYIGIHSTENVNDGYMGSGTHLKQAIKKYGIENFEKTILFDFDNPEEMILKESQLVDRKFIAREDVYNISCGGNWSTVDSVVVRDKEGNCFRVHKTDERWVNGELVSPNKGKTTLQDSNGNCSYVSLTDPRYLSGELVPVCKNKILVKDCNNQYYLIDKNDSRIVNNELIIASKNKITVKDCNNNTFQINVTDPRYLSGELVPVWKGCTHTKETKQKISEKSKIHQAKEKNSQYGTCWIHNIELKENKKIKKEDIQLWLDLGWILGRKMKI